MLRKLMMVMLAVLPMTFGWAATATDFYQVNNHLPNFNKVHEAYLQYYDSGKIMDDRKQVVDQAIKFLQQRVTAGDKKLAVVFDLDETLLSNWPVIQKSFPVLGASFTRWRRRGKDQLIQSTFRLYQAALKHHVAVFFITGRPRQLRRATVRNLKRVGIKKWQHLYLDPKGDFPNAAAYKTAYRNRITKQGYHIILSIGDQYSDLCGGNTGRAYKLPNPFYFIPGCTTGYLQAHQRVPAISIKVAS